MALAPACYADSCAEAAEELRQFLEPLAFHDFRYSIEEAPEELEELVEAHKMDDHAQADAERPDYLSDELLEYLNDRSPGMAIAVLAR